jgi:hypothetical protein
MRNSSLNIYKDRSNRQV